MPPRHAPPSPRRRTMRAASADRALPRQPACTAQLCPATQTGRASPLAQDGVGDAGSQNGRLLILRRDQCLVRPFEDCLREEAEGAVDRLKTARAAAERSARPCPSRRCDPGQGRPRQRLHHRSPSHRRVPSATVAPQVNPAPKPTRTTFIPGRRPRLLLHVQIGTEAAEVFPYRLGWPRSAHVAKSSRLAAASMIGCWPVRDQEVDIGQRQARLLDRRCSGLADDTRAEDLATVHLRTGRRSAAVPVLDDPGAPAVNIEVTGTAAIRPRTVERIPTGSVACSTAPAPSPKRMHVPRSVKSIIRVSVSHPPPARWRCRPDELGGDVDRVDDPAQAATASNARHGTRPTHAGAGRGRGHGVRGCGRQDDKVEIQRRWATSSACRAGSVTG